MLIYKEFKIRNILSKYIYSIINIRTDEKNKTITVFPDTCDYILYSSLHYNGLILKSTKAQKIYLDGEEIYLLRLKPYTLSFLEKNDKDFSERIYDLGNEIFRTRSILNVMSNTYHFLFEDIDYKFEDEFLFQMDIIDFIYEQKGDLSVEDLENHFGISIRTLQRRFKDQIKLTPKEYIDIIRFQSEMTKFCFLKTKKHRILPKWFKDYSHFSKFMKKYTNKSPKDFYEDKDDRFNSIYDIY